MFVPSEAQLPPDILNSHFQLLSMKAQELVKRITDPSADLPSSAHTSVVNEHEVTSRLVKVKTRDRRRSDLRCRGHRP